MLNVCKLLVCRFLLEDVDVHPVVVPGLIKT